MTSPSEGRPCEADQWEKFTGQASGPCPNPATHMESWFDEEGLEVWLCDEHASGEPHVDLPPSDRSTA
jgi:hypothetical protein